MEYFILKWRSLFFFFKLFPLSGLIPKHLGHPCLVRFEDSGFFTCHSFQEETLTLYRASFCPEGCSICPCLRTLSPLKVNVPEGALELSWFGNRINKSGRTGKGRRGREGWMAVIHPGLSLPSTLPKNSSELLAKVLRESSRAEPKCQVWVSEWRLQIFSQSLWQEENRLRAVHIKVSGKL